MSLTIIDIFYFKFLFLFFTQTLYYVVYIHLIHCLYKKIYINPLDFNAFCLISKGILVLNQSFDDKNNMTK